MKKQLLGISILFSLFIANFTFAQQNRSANVSTSGTHSLKKSAPNSKTNLLAVPNTTTSTCMSINLPAPATWSLVNYGTGTPIFTDGFVNGPNIYNDKEKAMYFDASASANTMITQVYVGFDKAYSATPTKTVAVKFYDGTSGTPGASIGQGTLSMATIMTDVSNNQYSLIIFPTPLTLPVSKRFFASVDVTALSFTTATKDSLSIVSNSDPQTVPCQTWEKWSTNAWYRYDNVSSWGLDISLLIHPFLTQAPIVASITVPTGTLCTGTSITYNSAGSTSPGTYDWFFTGATTATATGVTANTSYTAAGNYTTQMVVEDACGSFGVATKTINVNLSPTANASTSQTITCTLPTANLSGSGVSTYTWSGPGIVSGGNTASPTANTPGTYSLVGTTGGCISNVATVVLTSNTVAPSVSIGPSSNPVCIGSSATLTAGGAGTYSWSTGSSATSIVITPTITTNYVLTGTNTTNGCVGNTNLMITVNNPTTSAANSGPFCVGTTIILNCPAATSYTWAGPNSFASNLQNPTISNATLPMSGNYTVIVTIGTCTTMAATSVSISPLPIPAWSSNSPVCVGQPINFTGTGGTTYTWTGPNSFNSTSQNPTIAVSSLSNAGNYTLTVMASNSCTNSASGNVTVNPLPSVTANSTASVVCIGNSVTLNGGGASTYTWTGGVTDNVAFTPTVTDTYTVTGTDANGCSNTAAVTVTVSACTGMQQFGVKSSEFVVYPNPNNGDFTISLIGTNTTPTVEIYNTIGKLVYSNEVTSERTNFSTNLAAGIYFINLIENGKVIATQKLICK